MLPKQFVIFGVPSACLPRQTRKNIYCYCFLVHSQGCLQTFRGHSWECPRNRSGRLRKMNLHSSAPVRKRSGSFREACLNNSALVPRFLRPFRVASACLREVVCGHQNFQERVKFPRRNFGREQNLDAEMKFLIASACCLHCPADSTRTSPDKIRKACGSNFTISCQRAFLGHDDECIVCGHAWVCPGNKKAVLFSDDYYFFLIIVYNDKWVWVFMCSLCIFL